MKKLILKIIVSAAIFIFLSDVLPVKIGIKEPDNISDNMYVVYYDYYAKCWAVTNTDYCWVKIIGGSDPEKSLSSGLCYSNTFVVYGSAESIETDDQCKLYNINCTGWDIVIRDENGINRSYAVWPPQEKYYLTVYDYKWFDCTAEP